MPRILTAVARVCAALTLAGVLATAAVSTAHAQTPPLAHTSVTAQTPATAHTPALRQSDVSQFSYDSWHVEAIVGVDEGSGRARTTITETMQPRFPDFDQNRGIVRGIPMTYEGVSTDPRDVSVTDGTGAAVPFETVEEDGFFAILVGDDEFVHGLTTYVLSYTLSDTVLSRDDRSADEFYWDLLDFEHQQPISAFSAEVTFAPPLASALTGAVAC